MSTNEVAIADLGQVITGKTPSTKNAAFFDGAYQFVTPSDLDWKTYYCQLTERTVTEGAKKAHCNQFIPADALMVTCIGNTIGKCGISSGECLTNQQINTIIPYDGISRKFVYYLLIHNIELIRGVGLGGGAATPILNKSTFSRIKLRVPPKSSWEPIASILSSYDDLIENNRRRIQLLEQAARLLYKEWFVHLRFPSHEHTKIHNGIPEGWERQTLTNLAESVSYGFTASSSQEEIGPKFLRITDIVPPVLNWHDVPFCKATAEDIKRNRLETGDVVVARTGATVGYAKRISFLECPAVYASYLVRFRLHTPAISFIAGIFMESDAYKEYVKNQARGAAQPNANAKVLGSAVLLIPPKILQEQFVDYISVIFCQRDTLIRHNSRLCKARDLLLPRLMTGEAAV